MKQAPQLSFTCPIAWDSLKGSAEARHCTTCNRTIPNLSLLSDVEREAILSKLGTEEVCAAFYRRVSGELVTADEAKGLNLSQKIRQAGVGLLAASAVGLAAGCVASKKPEPLPSPEKPQSTVEPAKENDDTVILLMGIICPPKQPSKKIGPSGKTP